MKKLLVVVGILILALSVGRLLTGFTSKFISHSYAVNVTCEAVVHPGDGSSTAEDQVQPQFAKRVCAYDQGTYRDYGWPVVTHRVNTPNDPSVGAPLDDPTGYTWPVIGLMTDGVYANWALFSFCTLAISLVAIVAVPKLRRYAWSW